MRYSTQKDCIREKTVKPFTRHETPPKRKKRHHALNLLIIIGIVFWGSHTFSGKVSDIHGVQIELDNGNRICMSFGGEIKGIVVNGSVNLPGETFENITKVGNTKIFRGHSGKLTRIGDIGLRRDWRGNITKIGNARVFRDEHGSIVAVNGDPDVSPLFAINPPQSTTATIP